MEETTAVTALAALAQPMRLRVFRALVGVRRVVAAQASRTRVHRMETEDYASALLTLGNGAPGQLLATTAMRPGRPECIEVIGSLGSAVLEGGSLQIDFVDDETLQLKAEGGTGSGANIMDFPNDDHRAVLQDFVDAVTHNRAPRVTGLDALYTQQLIGQVLERAGGQSQA
jgi:predicted dehydrogenase